MLRENKQAHFMETEKGEVVDGETAHQVRQSARHIFTYFASKGHIPSKWTGADVEAVTYFRVQMYTQYPELRLCHQHWKGNKIASSVYPEWRRTYLRNQEHQAIKKEDPIDTNNQHTQKAQKRTRSLSPTGPRKSVKSQSNNNALHTSLPPSTSTSEQQQQLTTHNTELLEAPDIHPEPALPTGENVSEALANCPPNPGPSAPSTSLETCVRDPTLSLLEGETVGALSAPPALSVLSAPSVPLDSPALSVPSSPSIPSAPPALSVSLVPSSATLQPPHQHLSLAISPVPTTSSSDHLRTNRPRPKLKIINSL